MSSDAAPQKSSWADDFEDDDPQLTFKASNPEESTPQTAQEGAVSNEVARDDEEHQQMSSGLEESQYEVAVTLADIQGDPNSPLYSATKFEDLPLKPELLKGLYTLRFYKPSKIQAKALPLLLSNPATNLIGQSQSGTGKTAAFVLTMLERVNHSVNTPQALCLTPTRELARQIIAVAETMGQYLNIRTQFAVPQAVERGQQIDAPVVIGTPGTVLDCIKRRVLVTKDIKVFVLDEADNMLDQQGLGDQCTRVKGTMPKTAQILLFSATFPEQVINYAAKFAPNSNKITLKHEELTVKGIKQLYMDCASDEDKYKSILAMYGLMMIGSSIIFVKERRTADELKRRLEDEGHVVSSLHGAFEGKERDKVIDDFREGRANILITTNVLARGIDVAAVAMVVNYDIPTVRVERQGGGFTFVPDFETYLHRIGRTGRFGRVGVSITFVHDRESWEQMHAIEQFFGVEMTRINVDEDWHTAEKEMKKILKSAKAGINAKKQVNGVGSGN